MSDSLSSSTAPTATTLPKAPQPGLVIESQENHLASELREIWAYRELLYFLSWQAVKIRYKQTAVGIGWIILQPLLNAAILSLVFSTIIRIPVGDIPYPAFILTSLIFWTYFSNAVVRGAASLVMNANLITKVYFPRLLIPLSAVLVPLLDFILAFGVLLVVLTAYGIAPTWKVVLVPLFLLLELVCALTITLWFSALNVRYRDIGHLLPFILQVWMYLTPIIYPISLVPSEWRRIYSLNPMVTVVEGAKWALLGTTNMPEPLWIIASLALIVGLLVGGIVYFYRAQQFFADVI